MLVNNEKAQVPLPEKATLEARNTSMVAQRHKSIGAEFSKLKNETLRRGEKKKRTQKRDGKKKVVGLTSTFYAFSINVSAVLSLSLYPLND